MWFWRRQLLSWIDKGLRQQVTLFVILLGAKKVVVMALGRLRQFARPRPA
jgi:hypothetical protein